MIAGAICEESACTVLVLFVLGAVAWQLAVAVPDLTWYLAAARATPAVPVAIWQLRLPRRAQSKPRSTA